MAGSVCDLNVSGMSSGSSICETAVISPESTIGNFCNVSSHVFVANRVFIGSRVSVSPGAKIFENTCISDDVTIGPNVICGSSISSREGKSWDEDRLVVGPGVLIGAGAIVFPSLTIHRNAIVEPGSVVTRSVPPNAIVAGNPAVIVGYVNSGPGVNLPASRFFDSSEKFRVSKVRGVRVLNFPLINDMRGALTVGEFQKDIPFSAQRYFMVFDVPSAETRGEHAHRKCHQFLICARGSCAVVADDGTDREEFILDRPNIGLYLPPMIWGIQYKYSTDALLLVFASDLYDPDDYIRNYSDFLLEVGK